MKLNAALCACLLLSAGCATADAQPREARARTRPSRSNVLLIIADDVGNDKIGVYMEGDDQARPKTPHIDALAARGVRFLNAYANPVCSPTRATMLTGRYSFRTGIGSVIRRNDRVALQPFPAETPLPTLLERAGAGYDHSMVGKWHLSSDLVGGAGGPLDHGFNWTAGPERLNNYFRWLKQVNGKVARVDGYVTIDTTDDAVARANALREPWLLWVGYNAAHAPYHEPPPELHHRPDTSTDVLKYAAMVAALDTEIGRLLASIEPGVLANTTIIFLGDNGTPGPVMFPPSNRGKSTVYEGGINVPFIVAGRDVPPSSRGRTTAALVNTTDVFATVAEIAGVDPSVNVPHKPLDSVSILPVLADPDRPDPPRRFAYAEIFEPNGPGPYSKHDRAIRDSRWKLIRTYRSDRNPPTREEFYDLDAAPPGFDGVNLCPCPGNLTPEARAAYDRLVGELERLGGP